ncbi:MAG TPA: serine hydrolase domain-containing protein [Kofleriaceae bacterium]|jgi:CubicO group peptidase (beta-lactamase class C family)
MDRIAALLDDALSRGLGSAAAVSVGDAGTEVFRYVRGHRWRVPALGPPIDDHTPFDLASLTKPMATVAIAMVEPVALDTPVAQLVSHAACRGTVRQLLGHGAGCAAHVEFFRWLRAASPDDPRAALINRAAREPCDPPGIASVYSDLGYILLGAIVNMTRFAPAVAEPLALAARFAPTALDGAVATELDERGLVCGLVHDENAYYGGRTCGHAGLFGSIDDVAKFAAAMVRAANGERIGRFEPDTVRRFFTDAPIPSSSWRLGWDTPSPTPGVSQAGDRWPREHAVGHTGFTGTSLWLDLPRRRWCALLTNRVHPTRHAGTADAIKALRRAVNDAAIGALDQ